MKYGFTEVRLYNRALEESELQVLVESGRALIPKSPNRAESRELSLKLGDRYFVGALSRPAFLAVRIPAGPLAVLVEYAGLRNIEKIVFTRLDDSDPLSQRLTVIENRSPQIRDDELASILSYFLWNGPPDEALLRSAANGTLLSE